MTTKEMMHGWRLIRISLILPGTLLWLTAGPSLADVGREVGRVVAASGEAFAEAPDGSRRALICSSPIYVSDKLTTARGAELGIVSGDFYARIDEQSAVGFEVGVGGAPDLRVTRGHARLLDLGQDAAVNGAIETPGLRLANSGRDSEALVLSEKVTAISMICGREGPVSVQRVARPGEKLTAPVGHCVVDKPGEALYQAAASHPPLELLAADVCQSPVEGIGRISDRFSPYDVAGMLPAVGPGPPVQPLLKPPGGDILEPCSIQICNPVPTVRVGPITPTGPPPLGLP